MTKPPSDPGGTPETMTSEDFSIPLSDDEPLAQEQDASDHPKVSFGHPFFKRVEDLYFRLDDHTGEPVAVVRLGDEALALSFPGIRREFSLDDTEDGKMLETVAKGLKYVRILRIGDPVPDEIITRKASWEVRPQHKQIAYHRLALQLISWLSGDEHIITDAEEILQVAGDPTFRKKVNEAFSEAAEALGLGRENREQVVQYISELANELSYIEAMRDEFQAMRRMEQKIQELRRMYGTSRTVLEIADPVAKLMERAVKSFSELFEQADAQTGEIMAALKNIDAQKAFIQDMRDDMHARFLAWEEMLAEWDRLRPKPSEEAEDLLTRTYRFLAPRFMPVDEWAMMTKLQMNVVVGTKDRVTQKTIRKKFGGSMQWF